MKTLKYETVEQKNQLVKEFFQSGKTLNGFGFASFSYMITSIFINSSIATTPLVCIFIGIG